MDLDTAQLRAFLRVADAGHFGRAATGLGITQQALSKRVARLEKRLGLRLFDRGAAGAALTAAGESLRPHARSILAEVDLLAGHLAAGGEREIVVDDLYEPLAAHLWLRSAAEDPRLTVRSDAGHVGGGRVSALRDGGIDVAFGRADHEPWPGDLRRAMVLLEPLALLVGPRHRFADRARVAARDLIGERLWFPEQGSPPDWYELAAELQRDLGLRIADDTATVDFEHFLRRAADSAEAATFIGRAMEAPPAPLRVVPIVEPVPVFPWAVMWPKRVPEWVIDVLIEHVDSRYLVTMDEACDTAAVWMPAGDRRWMSPESRRTQPTRLPGAKPSRAAISARTSTGSPSSGMT